MVKSYRYHRLRRRGTEEELPEYRYTTKDNAKDRGLHWLVEELFDCLFPRGCDCFAVLGVRWGTMLYNIGVRKKVRKIIAVDDYGLEAHRLPLNARIPTYGLTTEYIRRMADAAKTVADMWQCCPVEWRHHPPRFAFKPEDSETVDCIWSEYDSSIHGTIVDCEAWIPALRPGGILIGHGFHSASNLGVKYGDFNRAIRALLARSGMGPITTDMDSIWYTRKPKS